MLTHTPKRILAPIDFSGPSLTALVVSKALARHFGARLDLVHVESYPPVHLFGGTKESVAMAQWNKERHRVQEKLEHAASGLPKSQVRLRLLRGWVPEELMRMSVRTLADLIVMGTHGRAGMERLFFGSIAEAVVRHTHVPVLTLHPRTSALRIQKILVPMNMTPYADRALRYALLWAQDLHARLSVLYVSEPRSNGTSSISLLHQHIVRLLGEDVARQVHVVVREGNVEQSIMEEAVSGKFDLIALAAHRKRFWSDYALGTTAERVLRHSPIPVLSVPSVNIPAARQQEQNLVYK